MGRLHSNGKGISASAIPYSRNPPAWLKVSPDQVGEQICKLARKGASPSQIGVVLRDAHGISQVKNITGMTDTAAGCPGGMGPKAGRSMKAGANLLVTPGNKILRILKAHGTMIPP